MSQTSAMASRADFGLAQPSAASGNWEATILLLSGASTMGKSHLTKTLLGPEFGAVSLQIDDMYTRAVTEANMLNAEKHAEKKEQQREARRHARDRKWASDAAKTTFFASYERHIRIAFEKARKTRSPVVLEGGSLRKDDEIAIVTRCADDIFGNTARIVRVTVQVPYRRWLQNRISRMSDAGVETAPIRKLTETAYKGEARRAIPDPHPRLADHVAQSAKDLRALMKSLDRSAAA